MRGPEASRVESRFLARRGNPPFLFEGENVPAIVADSFPALGKLTALRFCEWVQANPGGVISLPTGKTPEYFIRFVTRYLEAWDRPSVQRELGEHGLATGARPDVRSLHFVQMDEFYPINPLHRNSFHHFVRRFYVEGLGLDPARCMLIDLSRVGVPEGWDLARVWPDGAVDLSLRTRMPRTDLENVQARVIAAVDDYAYRYERRIRALGGIGFFLGGIGPDGHIAFNVRGTDFYSTTRLCVLNYESAAAAATDLGGIEVSGRRLAFTIGLATIALRPDVTGIIFAAGQAKARVVARALEGPVGLECPASVLSGLSGARFYLTRGAAAELRGRALAALRAAMRVEPKRAAGIVIGLARRTGKPLRELTAEDFAADEFAALLPEKTGRGAGEIAREVAAGIEDKISRGRSLPGDQVFLHTAPHHDDIALGYMPAIMHLVRDPTNRHHFAYMTSGFTAVTNRYVLEELRNLERLLRQGCFADLLGAGHFSPGNEEGRAREAYLCLNALAARDAERVAEASSRRLLRCLVEVYEEEEPRALLDRVAELTSYLETQYPGKKDLAHVQRLKGMLREWEGDLIWGYVGIKPRSVHHLRLGFYQGAIFTEAPKRQRDMRPVLHLLERIRPTILSVALDPEGSGPDTHYKVLQAIAGALREYVEHRDPPLIWGYRNVWFHFEPEEATLYVPTTLNTMAVMEHAFLNSFRSQRDASFPSPEYDGPFCYLAGRKWISQFETIKTCLGEEFFRASPIPRLRAVRGLVFLRELTVEEFFAFADEARHTTEEGQAGQAVP